MKTGRLMAWGAAGALAVSMSACNMPSTAAVVDGQRITTGEVTRAARGYNETSARLADAQGQRAEAVPESAVLSILMRGKAAESLAKKQGVSLDGETNAMLADPDLAAFVSDPDVRPLFKGLAGAEAMGKSMGEEEFEEALNRVKHTINPRYGLPDMGMLKRDPNTGGPMTRSNSLSNRVQG